MGSEAKTISPPLFWLLTRASAAREFTAFTPTPASRPPAAPRIPRYQPDVPNSWQGAATPKPARFGSAQGRMGTAPCPPAATCSGARAIWGNVSVSFSCWKGSFV